MIAHSPVVLCRISGCLFIIHYRKAPGDVSPRPTLQPGYDLLYYVLLVSTSVIMPIISILLPTVGADQVSYSGLCNISIGRKSIGGISHHVSMKRNKWFLG